MTGEANVHHDQNRVHSQRQQRWPLQQEPGQDQDEADILGVAEPFIDTGSRHGAALLRCMEHGPAHRNYPEATADEDEAGDVEWTEVRVYPPFEHLFEQMARVM